MKLTQWAPKKIQLDEVEKKYRESFKVGDIIFFEDTGGVIVAKQGTQIKIQFGRGLYRSFHVYARKIKEHVRCNLHYNRQTSGFIFLLHTYKYNSILEESKRAFLWISLQLCVIDSQSRLDSLEYLLGDSHDNSDAPKSNSH